MPPRSRLSRTLLPALLAAGLAALFAACSTSPLTERGAVAPITGSGSGGRPARRLGGPRLPAPFGGAEPASLGLTQVEGLLWLRGEEAPAWPPGGVGLLAPQGTAPGTGLTLRTDHVLLETDLAPDRALPLARVAQAQVESLLERYGDALDLRLPAEPLRVIVFARRRHFEAALGASIPEPTGWNAYYDARDGAVRVCAEPSRVAPMPLLADLKHELTHAVVDLGAPAPVPHLRILGGLHFWLWEGFAVYAETLGESPDMGSWPTRWQRFWARAGAGQAVPLETFFGLDQPRFEGRHYDQAATVMRFLMEDPLLGPRTVALLRRLIRGDVLRRDVARELGVPVAELERRWRTTFALPGGG